MPDELHQIFAVRIVECRKAKGWSQAELARQMGTTSGGICDYEKARTGVTLATVARFAATLGVPPTSLLELQQKKKSTRSA